MHFRTELNLQPIQPKFSIQSNILLAGSCFAENIGAKLQRYRFPVSSNPFGVIFNPISLSENLQQCLRGKLLSEKNYIQSQEVWRHYQLHSKFASTHLDELKKTVEQQWQSTHQFLQKTDFLILTWGTAWVYRLKETQTLVANCHKIPAKAFEKELLSVEVIYDSIAQLLTLLPQQTKVILTVSPVRHAKDTLVLNSVSKSTLRLACHQLENQFEQVSYFPSYELLMDDLRDYRFYTSDMLHPSKQAVDYVWEKFLHSCINEPTLQFIQKFEKILQQIEHKPSVEGTQAHQKLLLNTLKILEQSKDVDVSDLIEKLREKLLHYPFTSP